MAPTKGLLYVTMQPHDDLPASQFHDWYNNEHGPTRLRFPAIFENGFRYKATDGEKPEWLAIYDVTDMAEMIREPYLSVRKPPKQTQRERDTMAKIHKERRFWDLVHEQRSDAFIKFEDVKNEGEKGVLRVVRLTIHSEFAEEVEKWYKEEHVRMLSKVPGWRRSRLFVTSTVDDNPEVKEYIGMHNYAPENGLENSEEYTAATSTTWREQTFKKAVKARVARKYELAYTFGPAPRDISNAGDAFHSYDDRTITEKGTVQSFITTEDGVELSYKLEGSPDPSAPLIVLCNSILVDWGIWDSFISNFLSKEENKKYRILRYNTRGRKSNCGEQAVNMDVLASDVISLLDALRVQKAATIIGVSMGGATALKVALKYPDRVSSFISCDTNSHAPESNRKAWGERIAMCEAENAPNDTVGSQLAEATVRRWFVKENHDGGEYLRVKDMVRTNSLQGFKKSVEALFAYDMREEMKSCNVRGAFFVGAGDGILPDTMKTMSTALNNGGEYVAIDGAGHLPMVEKPKQVAEEVTRFLKR